MTLPASRFILIGVAGIFLSAAIDLIALEDPKKTELPPIKALLVTGGCSHDYSSRKIVLVEGIRQRVGRKIEWMVRHEGDGESDARIPLFEGSDWADGYDIIVHDYCFPRVRDQGYINRILAPHRDGLPAVLIHGTMHSFRSGDDRWFDFCGVTSRGHERDYALVVEALDKAHPILRDMNPWKIPSGQLYRIDKLHKGVTALSYSVARTGEKHVNSWTHRYGPGQARVFASTIGNETSTLLTPACLDLFARGFLWALDDLSDGNFVKIAPEESVKGLSGAEPDTVPDAILPGPGLNCVRGGQASALSVGGSGETGAEMAIDGNVLTLWEAAEAGPSSWQVALPQRERIGAIALTWKDQSPGSYLLEGSDDLRAWRTLAAVSDSNGRSPQTLVEVEPLGVRYLRLSFPETPPGVVPGLREFGAFASIDDVPSAFLENVSTQALPSPPLLTMSKDGVGRKMRLSPGLSLDAAIPLADVTSPIQLIPTASGKAFALLESADETSRRSVYSLEPTADGSVKLALFLDSLDPDTVIAWDGEWLYTLSGGSWNAFRDTNGDGSADERFRRGRIFSLPGSASSQGLTFTRLRLGPDGWFYALIESGTALTVFNSRSEAIDVPRSGIVRFRRDGSEFGVIVRSSVLLDDFRWETGGAISLHRFGRSDKAGSTEVFLPTPLSGLIGSESSSLSWPPSEKEDHRWSRIGQVVAGERVYTRADTGNGSVTESPGIQLIARIEGLMLFEDDGPRYWFAASDGRKSTVGLLTRSGDGANRGVEWDDVRTADLLGFMTSDYPSVRREVVFEILRRKRAPVSDLEALLAGNPATQVTEGILSTLSGMDSNRTPPALLRVAHSQNPANKVVAFHYLGDYPGMTNHSVFDELTRSTVPSVTAGILVAILRSGTGVDGLEELVLSFTSHPDEDLASTARAFLVAREASGECFKALDDPARESDWTGAMDVLSGIYRTTVAEGIVLRLERTGSPVLRRLGLKALCRLYYRSGVSERTWEGTHIADRFLSASLRDHRVDKPELLNEMRSAGIPISEPEMLAHLAMEDIALEAFAVEVLLGASKPLSVETLSWLGVISKSDTRDGDLRLKAISLIVQHSGKDDYRRCFAETAGRETISSFLGTASMVLDRWLSRSDHTDNLPWLIDQARGTDEGKGRLGWQTLLSQADRVETKETDKEEIKSAVAAVRGEGGSQLLRLIELMPEGVGPKSGEVTAAEIVKQISAQTTTAREGAALFKKLSCDSCHNVHGEGPAAAPDLAIAVKSLTTVDLVEAILKPSKRVTPGFETYLFEMKDGRQLRGFVENRDGTTITARDRAGNLFKVVVDDIHHEWKDGETMMNCGVAATLPVKEFAALFHYIRSLAEP